MFGDRFVVLRTLGVGAFGVVYEVDDRVTGDRLALKTLRHAETEDILSLKQEFRALALLRHPNLVRLYELYEDGEHCFFTMELIEGSDMLSWVRSGRSDAGFDEIVLRATLSSLAQGLHGLHAEGFAHCDVKPQNIIVDAGGRAVILDLGSAVEYRSRERRPRRTMGSPPFTAPEQLRNHEVSPASDWFSVGVFLHCVLAGLDPWGTFDSDADALSAAPIDLVVLSRRLMAPSAVDRPDGDTVLAALNALPVPATSARARAMNFVGRQRELATLAAAVAKAQAGEGAIVVVTGGPGIGKTALVEHCLREIRGAVEALLVLDGRCYARESVAYNGLDGVVDRLSQHLCDEAYAGRGRRWTDGPALATLFPSLKHVPGLAGSSTAEADPELRARAARVLRQVLADVAKGRTLVVFIDDLQWADQESLALWHALANPPLPLLLVATLRHDAEAAEQLAGATLAALRLDPATLVIDLGPLSADASVALVGQQWPSAVTPAEAELVRLAHEAGGHPLLLVEVARSAAEGTLSRTVRPHLGDLLRQRVGRLGAGHRRLLDLLAVAGLPIPLDVVAAALAAEPGRLRAMLGDLEVARFVRPHPDTGPLDFITFHDRVRESVAAAVEPVVLVALHGRLADAYESVEGRLARPLVVLTHLEGAQRIAEAGKYAVSAADRLAAVLAFETAAGLYSRALTLDGGVGAERAALEERYAATLLNAGRSRDAGDHYLTAAAGADTAGARRARTRQAAACLLIHGDTARGLALFEGVLRESGLKIGRSPLRLFASTLLAQAHLRLRGFGYRRRDERDMTPDRLEQLEGLATASRHLGFLDPVLGYSFRTRALLLALELGHSPLVIEGIALEGVSRAARGGTRGQWFSNSHLERARTLVETDADRAILAGCSGTAAVFGGEFGRAASELAQAIADLEEHAIGGQRTGGLRHARTWYLKSIVDLGRLPTLRRELARVRELAIRQGDLLAAAVLPRICAPLWLAEDRPDDLLAELAAHPAHEVLISPSVSHWYDIRARIEAALYRSDILASAGDLRRDLKAIGASLFGRRFQLSRVEIRAMTARLELGVAAALPPMAGSRRAALTRVHALTRRLRGERGMPYAGILATGLEAGYHALEGRTALARDALGQLLVAAQAADLELLAACARLRLGGLGRVEAPDEWFTAAGVIRPERLTNVYLPGFESGLDHSGRVNGLSGGIP